MDAITDSFGNQSVIARRCGVGRSTITMFLKKNANSDIRAMIEHEREKAIDIAELGLSRKITEGNLSAIMFYLKTQGKKRGYVEKQEIDSTVTADININKEIMKLLDDVKAESD